MQLALKQARRWWTHLGNWVVRQEAVVLVGLLLAAAGVWGFAEIADEVMEGDSRGIDEAILSALRSGADPLKPVGPAWLSEAAVEVTAFGSITVLVIVVAGVLGYLAVRRLWGALLLVLGASL